MNLVVIKDDKKKIGISLDLVSRKSPASPIDVSVFHRSEVLVTGTLFHDTTAILIAYPPKVHWYRPIDALISLPQKSQS
ncbi:hypothetical protein Nepgr_003644 [Nepenthes gracilis]|uniref:Uncharacterized protein n=1 Tax=Nepenthes gracilis TaxID=150966 RepID=A0AAD3RZW5_NEPGR|nr:hypothetical protein Nepgr_003644 [Nepenthes gracilis]